jgi:hypothetical protein
MLRQSVHSLIRYVCGWPPVMYGLGMRCSEQCLLLARGVRDVHHYLLCGICRSETLNLHAGRTGRDHQGQGEPWHASLFSHAFCYIGKVHASWRLLLTCAASTGR